MKKLPRKWLATTCIIAALALAASLAGLFDPLVYRLETANWTIQARGQDIGNLMAIPLLLLGAFFAGRKSVGGYFIWLGCLMYFIYAYIVYAFAVHFNYLFLVYVAILGLSAYTIIAGLAMKETLNKGRIPEGPARKFPAGILIATGIVFEFLWLSEIVPAVIAGKPPASLAPTGLWINPIHVIDLSVVLPGMIMAGWLLWKKNSIGSLFTPPWLMFSVLMGASIVVTMVMMLAQGDKQAVVPLTMVGTIVIASSLGLIVYLRNLK